MGLTMSIQKLILISGTVLFVFLLTAGCIFSPGTTNQTGNATPSQTNCPPLPANVTPYIFINHINNFTLGDIVEINGTTNSPGPLTVWVTNDWGNYAVPLYGNQTMAPRYFHVGNVTITNDCKERKWSYMLDSRDLVNCPGCRIKVWTLDGTSGAGEILLLPYQDQSDRQSWREVRI